ncbi:MAG TPA: hypothetical protein VGE30_02935 [Candidatus Saccharimonadales bacterium]
MLQVIYIPGLGDERIAFQRLVVSLWRIWVVSPHIFHMRWSDSESYEDKFARLTTRITMLSQNGPVALVAASAGATAAINACAACPQIVGVVCIAGKVNNPRSIGDGCKRRAPSFWESAQHTPSALKQLTPEQKSSILSVRGRMNKIVPAQDSIIAGAHNRVTWTAGHAFTIAAQLLLGAPFFLRFIRRRIDKKP